jgi:hypothetical protein
MNSAFLVVDPVGGDLTTKRKRRRPNRWVRCQTQNIQVGNRCRRRQLLPTTELHADEEIVIGIGQWARVPFLPDLATILEFSSGKSAFVRAR